DEIWASFGDLAEEYLDGSLSEADSRRFERQLRLSPAFHELFENEKALYGYSAKIALGVPAHTEPETVAQEARRTPLLMRFIAVKPIRLAFVSLLALVAFILWLTLRTREIAPHASPSSSPQITLDNPHSPDKTARPSLEPSLEPPLGPSLEPPLESPGS